MPRKSAPSSMKLVGVIEQQQDDEDRPADRRRDLRAASPNPGAPGRRSVAEAEHPAPQSEADQRDAEHRDAACRGRPRRAAPPPPAPRSPCSISPRPGSRAAGSRACMVIAEDQHLAACARSPRRIICRLPAACSVTTRSSGDRPAVRAGAVERRRAARLVDDQLHPRADDSRRPCAGRSAPAGRACR